MHLAPDVFNAIYSARTHMKIQVIQLTFIANYTLVHHHNWIYLSLKLLSQKKKEYTVLYPEDVEALV